MGCGLLLTLGLSSPGLTGRSSSHRRRQGLLDCPVKPDNDTDRVRSYVKRAYVGGDPCGRPFAHRSAGHRATTRVAPTKRGETPVLPAVNYEAKSRVCSDNCAIAWRGRFWQCPRRLEAGGRPICKKFHGAGRVSVRPVKSRGYSMTALWII